MKKIAILGCGWLGYPLAVSLKKNDYSVNGSATNIDKLTLLEEEGIHAFSIKFENNNFEIPEFFLEQCEVLIITIPPSRFEKSEYLQLFVKAVCACIENGVKKIIYTSSTSVYGNVNGEISEESPVFADTPNAAAIIDVETYLLACPEIEATILRFGGLAGPNRNPANFFSSGKSVPNANQPVNMVHLNDCIGVIEAVLAFGVQNIVFNVCSPEHPTREMFYAAAITNFGNTLPEMQQNEMAPGKTVSAEKVQQVLNYNFKFKNPMDFIDECN